MASRGKYTLLKMLEFVVNVPDTLLMQDEKKPHSAGAQFLVYLAGTALWDMAVDMSGLIKIHAGPSTVCLYMTLKSRLTKSQIRSL